MLTLPTDGFTPSTLFEQVNQGAYSLYTDLGMGDVVEKATAVVYAPLQELALLLSRGAISLTWWLDSILQLDGMGTRLGELMGDSSRALGEWLLPTCLIIGGTIAFALAKSGRNALSQVLWTLASGVVAVALMTSGPALVGGLDTVRQSLGTSIATIGGGGGGVESIPFAWQGSSTDDGSAAIQLKRRSGDAVWRVFGASTWCQTQFGSQEACKRYGAAWLKLDTQEAKKRFIDQTVKPREGGDEGATVRYLQGHDPSSRLVNAFWALLLNGAAAAVIASIAIEAMLLWVTALLLAAFALVGACLLIVPGWARGKGQEFFSIIGGLTLISGLVAGVLSAMLLATTAVVQITAPLGWFPVVAMSLAVLFAARRVLSVLKGIFLSAGAGGGSVATGMMAMMVMRRISQSLSRNRMSTQTARQRAGEQGSAGAPGRNGAATSRHGATSGGGSVGPQGQASRRGLSSGERTAANVRENRGRTTADAPRRSAAQREGFLQRRPAQPKTTTAAPRRTVAQQQRPAPAPHTVQTPRSGRRAGGAVSGFAKRDHQQRGRKSA